MNSSPARWSIRTRSAHGISRSTSRARWAFRMSRAIKPAFAWLTSATGSPVAKWATGVTSRLRYGSPHRSTGK